MLEIWDGGVKALVRMGACGDAGDGSQAQLVSDVSITLTRVSGEDKLGGKGTKPTGVCCGRG